ncbi:MAG: hypothetical protein HYV97_09395 [Bdellovibrio sp.]|nr:hypothetical protein [Bdellovibrio sp.]
MGIFLWQRKINRPIQSSTEAMRTLENADALKLHHAPTQLPLPARLNALSYHEGPKSWKKSMEIAGQKLQAQSVTHIILLHGTFAGDDPLDIFSNTFEQKSRRTKWLRAIYPLRYIQQMYRKVKDKIIGNVGNFTTEYCVTLERGLKTQIQVHRFHWPSGNHHLARIRGLLSLVDLVLNLQLQKKERILMIGHSHAGQLFTALTQMAQRPAHFSKVLGHELRLIENPEVFQLKLEKLYGLDLDIVTWGSAPRYKWHLPSHWKLVHLLNFRKIPPRFPNPWKLLTAGYGDSIYLLAGPGSDSLAPFGRDRKRNQVLDSVFGVGLSLRHWWFSIQTGIKLHNEGRHFFIDYHDAGVSRFFRSFLGHGIYTHPGLMLFNFEIMINGLYSEKEKKD